MAARTIVFTLLVTLAAVVVQQVGGGTFGFVTHTATYPVFSNPPGANTQKSGLNVWAYYHSQRERAASPASGASYR